MTLRRPLRWRAATVVGMLSLLSGGAFPAWAAIDLSGIRLPPGFRIELFSDRVPDARSMTLAEEGTVYVGSLAKGRVYALKDGDGDGFAEQVRIVASGLDYPNGVAWWQGSLYIAEVSRLLRLKDPSAAVEAQPEVVYEGFPGDKHHGWKYLRVGPDDKLYTAVGAPCNVCQPSRPIYGTLLRMDLDGSHLEILARGVRNSVGFDFHPETRELWFTDNGRDWLGDDRPPDELNRLGPPGSHYGFPFCFGEAIADPEFGKLKPCRETVAPEWSFPAHVAALGARFLTGSGFPAEYRHQLFVAQHGSWNRSQPQGYRVVMVRFEQGRPVAEAIFAEGWLKADGKVTGRPVDLLELPDGSLLVSDDKAGAIYRIRHVGAK